MRAKIEDFDIPEMGPAQWASQPGFFPAVSQFFVVKGVARQLRNLKRGLTLRIGDRTIKELRLIAISPGYGAGDVETSFERITLADRRYDLLHDILDCTLNMRRRTGVAFANQDRAATHQVNNANAIPEEEYYPITLNPATGKPWTSAEFFIEMLGRSNLTLLPIPQGFPSGDLLGGQGFSHRGTIADILTQLMTGIPRYEFNLDDDGVGYFYDRSNRTDGESWAANVARYGTARGGGVYGYSALRIIRAKSVRIHFECAAEMLFRYIQQLDREYATQSPAPLIPGDIPAPRLENVIVNPVEVMPYLGEELVRGSIINWHAFLIALADANRSGEIPLPINARTNYGPLSESYVNDMFSRRWVYYNSFCLDNGGLSNPLYRTIGGSVFGDYRKYFRLQAHWARHVLTIEPYRIAYLQTSTGTRVRSPVWCQFTARPGQRFFSTRKRTDANERFQYNERDPNTVTSIDTLEPAPAFIDVDDQDAKTLRLQFRRGQFGDVEEFEPITPSVRVQQAQYAAVRTELGSVPIENEWGMATILTLRPIPRTSMNHFHTIEVTPKEAAKAIGLPEDHYGPCEGPTIDIFVEPIEGAVALFAYSEGDEVALSAPFFDTTSRFPESALANLEDIRKLALAHAAGYYYTVEDNLEGVFTAPNAGQDVRLKGSGTRVLSTPDMHTVEFTTGAPPINPLAFVPQRLVDRLMRRIK